MLINAPPTSDAARPPVPLFCVVSPCGQVYFVFCILRRTTSCAFIVLPCPCMRAGSGAAACAPSAPPLGRAARSRARPERPPLSWALPLLCALGAAAGGDGVNGTALPADECTGGLEPVGTTWWWIYLVGSVVMTAFAAVITGLIMGLFLHTTDQLRVFAAAGARAVAGGEGRQQRPIQNNTAVTAARAPSHQLFDMCIPFAHGGS